MNDQEDNKTQEQALLRQLVQQSNEINGQLEQLNQHKLIQTYNSIPRLLWFHLLKGTAFGLGSVLGATVVLSSLVYVLSQIEFIPVIGDWISEIIKVVQSPAKN